MWQMNKTRLPGGKIEKKKLFNYKQNCYNPFYDWTILKQIRKKKNKQNEQPTNQENR